MTAYEIRIQHLDLAQTLGCGQTFRWKPLVDGSWKGPLGDQLITLSRSTQGLRIEAVPGGRRAVDLVTAHIRAADDIPAIQRMLSKDPVIAKGAPEVRGLRIVKIDEWECLVSFMLATYANIPRISKMIETLADRYGEEIAEGVHTFPSIERMNSVSERELANCGLGYRAKYVHEVSRVVDPDSLSMSKKLNYTDLRERLKGLPGVGDKVADCVCLFGFGRLESFPIDVWIERALARLYHKRGTYKMLREFASQRFGQYAGYAQEYLYYNERAHAPDGSCVFSQG